MFLADSEGRIVGHYTREPETLRGVIQELVLAIRAFARCFLFALELDLVRELLERALLLHRELVPPLLDGLLEGLRPQVGEVALKTRLELGGKELNGRLRGFAIIRESFELIPVKVAIIIFILLIFLVLKPNLAAILVSVAVFVGKLVRFESEL